MHLTTASITPTTQHQQYLQNKRTKLYEKLANEGPKNIARILGIDASDLSAEGLQNLKNIFAEAYEITAFIADDPETFDMLTQFGKDCAGAQSSIEWA